MKTIDKELAQYIAQDWHGGQSSALYSFGSTGIVLASKKEQYLAEVAAILINSNTLMRKEVLRVSQLQRFFFKCLLVPVSTKEGQSYYEDQLDRLGAFKTAKVKIIAEKGETKWLDLNDESASAIVEFLSNNFTLTLK